MKNFNRRVIRTLVSFLLCITLTTLAPISASATDPYEEHGLCITEVAKKEVGYTEGAGNSNKYGWSAGWCAMFIGWCAEQAEILDVVPYKDSPYKYKQHYANLGLYSAAGSSYVPRVGDLLFTAGTYASPDHISIVIGVDGTNIISVDGNWGAADAGKVAIVTRAKNDSSIVAYVHPNYTTDHEFVWDTIRTSHKLKCTLTACGYETNYASHSLFQNKNSSSHWQECSECAYERDHASHIYTYTSTHHTCSDCSYSSLHSFTPWTSLNQVTHTRSCSCGKTESQNHVMVPSGNTMVCSGCNYTVMLNKVPDETA